MLDVKRSIAKKAKIDDAAIFREDLVDKLIAEINKTEIEQDILSWAYDELQHRFNLDNHEEVLEQWEELKLKL